MKRSLLIRTALVAPVAIFAAVAFMSACESDQAGHTKTTSKETVSTPEGHTTVTETHVKDTTITPK